MSNDISYLWQEKVKIPFLYCDLNLYNNLPINEYYILDRSLDDDRVNKIMKKDEDL